MTAQPIFIHLDLREMSSADYLVFRDLESLVGPPWFAKFFLGESHLLNQSDSRGTVGSRNSRTTHHLILPWRVDFHMRTRDEDILKTANVTIKIYKRRVILSSCFWRAPEVANTLRAPNRSFIVTLMSVTNYAHSDTVSNKEQRTKHLSLF